MFQVLLLHYRTIGEVGNCEASEEQLVIKIVNNRRHKKIVLDFYKKHLPLFFKYIDLTRL